MSNPGQDAGVHGARAAYPTSPGLFVVERRLPKVDDHQLTVLQAALTSAASRFSDRGDAVHLLGALVDKSILKRQLRGISPPRYWLLETMRQYGRERLREIGEEAAARQRHFDWVRALAEAIGACDGRQVALFDRMHRERDNLWAALDFCSRQVAGVAAGAELAHNLLPYRVSCGPFGDVRLCGGWLA